MSRDDAHARPCPACGSARSHDAFQRAGFQHRTCDECGTLFVKRAPDPDTLEAEYLDPDYHEDVEAYADRMLEEGRARARIMAELGAHTIVEVGSGAGYFLEAALEQGLAVQGIDPSRTGALARARGLPVFEGFLDDFTTDETYDGAVMFEVLEHIPEPVDMLRRTHTLLRPGGILGLSTPSWSGIPARLLRSRFPMICPPLHLELFTREGLRRLLERGGFRPIRWRSFTNMSGEDIARNVRRYFLGESSPARIASDIVGRIGALPTRWMDRAGLGTSFEVYARRID